MRRALPLALCLSLLACERAVPAIGDVAADRTPWASLDAFAHYRGLLQGATTVGELITQPLTFTARPTPRALLQSQRASNPAARPDAVPLSVLSYNVAMLDVSLFGVVPYTATPTSTSAARCTRRRSSRRATTSSGCRSCGSSADVRR
jgi:hypothetical protein